jgi:hypothetical protein
VLHFIFELATVLFEISNRMEPDNGFAPTRAAFYANAVVVNPQHLTPDVIASDEFYFYFTFFSDNALNAANAGERGVKFDRRRSGG